MKTAVIITAFILGASRIYLGLTIPPESPDLMDVYKTVAHLFIGGLAVAWWTEENMMTRGHLGTLFWGLNAIEVVMAVLSRV